MSDWGWPQWVMAALYMIAVLVNASMHGKVTYQKVNAPARILGAAIGAWVLYMGGFW